MGRTKGFAREDVLNDALKVFWKQGFKDTSLQDLERATGVNKSGLYSEFKDKDELFVETLKQYTLNNGAEAVLTQLPLGRNNLRHFLELGITCKGPKGCFVANSIREYSILPPKARTIIEKHMSHIKDLVRANVAAENPRLEAAQVSEVILTYNAGQCLAQNLGAATSSTVDVKKFLGLLLQ